AKGKELSADQWKKFAERLSFFEGDPNDAGMYSRLGKRLEEMSGSGASPNHLFYLSVPPSVSPVIVAGLGKAGLAGNEKGWSRIIVEKPFGRDLTSARQLNAEISTVFDEHQVYRIDHYVGEEKVKLLRSIRPLTNAKDVATHTVRGQYSQGTINGKPVPGYREEKGVAKDSRTETYAAVEFHIENWRWSGVPFYVRAGKRLAKPLTEIRVHLKPTPQALFSRNRTEHIEKSACGVGFKWTRI